MRHSATPPRAVESVRAAPGFEELVQGLTDPEALPGDVEDVQILQTHISVLFFTESRVYKLKKPVRLPFLDYTRVEDRKHFCEEEIRLNSRTTSDVYVGLLPVTRDPEGRVAIDGEGETVDWVVAMRRLPADRMLDRLLAEGRLEKRALFELARFLARFHDRARTGPKVNRFGLVAAVVKEVTENIEQLADAADERPDVLSPEAAAFLKHYAAQFPLDRRSTFEQRVADWRIREGHGDLHSGNVCLPDDSIQIYDCVEFDPALRCGDVAWDLAFLLMDLDHHGHLDAARRLRDDYVWISGDDGLPEVLAYYQTHRALIRAKVALARLDSPELDDSEALDEARDYVQLGLGYAQAPTLVLLCGPPGCGKSTSAAYVAGRLRARRIRSDVVRRAAGEPADYSDAGRRDVYETMLEHAAAELEQGRSVVVDASFARESFRRPFLDAATRLGLATYVLRLSVPDHVADRRLQRRQERGTDPSEADAQVARAERERFEEPDEFGRRVVQASGEEPPSRHGSALLQRMIEERSEVSPDGPSRTGRARSC